MSNIRAVAIHRDDPKALGELLSGTLGAQLALTVLAGVITLIAYLALTQLGTDARLLSAGFASIVVQAFAPIWFFKGMELMHTAAVLDIVSRVARMLLIFALVHSPADTWLAFVCDAGAALLVLALSTRPIFRIVRLSAPSLAALRVSLRDGFATFVVRISTNLFSSGTVFVLGLAVPPALVGMFGGADRIVTTLRSALNPGFEALFPRIARLAVQSPVQAKRLIWRSLLYAELIAIPLTLGLILFAPLVVRVLLGAQFAARGGLPARACAGIASCDVEPDLRDLLAVPAGLRAALLADRGVGRCASSTCRASRSRWRSGPSAGTSGRRSVTSRHS